MGVPGIETFDNKMLRYDNKRSLNRCVRIIARRHRGRSPTAVVVVVNVVVMSVVVVVVIVARRHRVSHSLCP